MLDGGRITYRPFDPAGGARAYDDANDGRLLAEAGADFRGTYSSRIADPRYRSDIDTEPARPLPLGGSIAGQPSVTLHGPRVAASWSRDAAAATYDIALRREDRAWHVVRVRLSAPPRA